MTPSIMPSSDFTRLSAQYNATILPTTPAKASVSATTINCPAQNSSLLASTNLPPTPDESACTCVNSNALACQLVPASVNQPVIVGALTKSVVF